MDYILRNIKALLLVFVLSLTLTACNHKGTAITYNHNFKAGVKFYNSISKTTLDSISTAYNKIPQPGIGDLIIMYKVKAHYYWGQAIKHDTPAMYEKAVAFTDSALNLLNHCTNDKEYTKEYAELNILKGYILFNAKKYDEAYFVFYLAKVSLQTKDKGQYNYLLASLDNSLANICYTQHRYNDAKALYHEAVNELKGQESYGFEYYATMQGDLDNIGLCYANTDRPDSAIYYYNAALNFIQQKKAWSRGNFDQVAAGVVYGNRAKAYENTQLYNLAKADYYKGISINEQKGFDILDAYQSKLSLANLYVKTNKPDSAKKIFDVIDGKLGFDPPSLIRYYKAKADYFTQVNNDKATAEYLKKYIDLKNAHEATLINFNRTDFNKDFAMLDQRYKVAVLEKQNQFKNFYLIGAIIFCLMCVAITLVYLQSRKQSRTIISNMDIYNQQLQLAVEALEQSNFDFNKMMNVMGHDLKNPLIAIRNIAEILLLDDRYATDDKDALELISNSSHNLIFTINDLLDVRNNFNHNPKDLEVTDLEELLINSVALMKYSAREKHQIIHLDTISGTYVKINRVKIWRVINNLIINAIKFSKSHSAIFVSMQYVNNNVQIIVLDKGIGVPDNLKDKLFDLFTEAKRKGTHGEQSFGLGLHTSKQIIEAHSGKIWFESTENNGSVFYLSLPVHQLSTSKSIA